MKRTVIITGIIVVVAIIILIIFSKATSNKDISNLYVEAMRGQFDILVTTTGELEAENSTDIKGPELTGNRRIRVREIAIQDLVPEGTEVVKGDFIATLDRTAFDNSLKDELEKLETYEADMEVKVLDTAVTLSNLRDNIKNLQFTVEEAEITLQQSKYEPPTTIRQAEIALDKANRSLDQTIRSYSLRVEQAKSETRTIRNRLIDQREYVHDIKELLAKFDITAPSPGMVIYKRDRSGTKRKIGSSINPWDNVVATLPDMSSMLSKTYVNEIDISKVKVGQRVEIMVDAFPERSYTGSVTSVANIGEQLPNADAKVFEVLIKVDGSDPILRPSMTTGNKIVTKTINDVIYIPLESVQAGTDSIPFVYLKNGYKQIVVLGESNENNVVIEQGLEEGTSLYLNTPEEPETFKFKGEELIPVIQERARIKLENQLQQRQDTERHRERGSGRRPGSSQMMQQNQGGENQPGDTSSVKRAVNMRTNRQNAARDTTVRQRSNSQPVQ